MSPLPLTPVTLDDVRRVLGLLGGWYAEDLPAAVVVYAEELRSRPLPTVYAALAVADVLLVSLANTAGVDPSAILRSLAEHYATDDFGGPG